MKTNYYELRLNKRKNLYGEYVVKCYLNSKYHEDGTYYTDDYNDAINTMQLVQKALQKRNIDNMYFKDKKGTIHLYYYIEMED